jgi:hypothetical protein
MLFDCDQNGLSETLFGMTNISRSIRKTMLDSIQPDVRSVTIHVTKSFSKNKRASRTERYEKPQGTYAYDA